ncbi:MAG: hypothetical protein J6D21_04380 [Clostridia bacterium]|nr:hypothetical protein [Clostridia bacterium]
MAKRKRRFFGRCPNPLAFLKKSEAKNKPLVTTPSCDRARLQVSKRRIAQKTVGEIVQKN